MDRAVYLRMAAQDRTHWWFVARRRILHEQISRLGLPPGARILEVGCGPGGNLEMLSSLGTVDAMDSDSEACRVAQERSGISVLPGRLPHEIPFDGSEFDLIAAFDVIEHVAQDAEAVAAIARRLKPGGIFVMTVPAYAWMWSAHDTHHHHHRRYTRTSARALLASAGLSVRKCSYFNTLLFPLIVAVRLLKKLRGSGAAPDDDIPPDFVNAALTNIFAAERFPLRYVSFPFGVSVICIARRESSRRET